MKKTMALGLLMTITLAGLTHAEEWEATCGTISSKANMGARASCIVVTNANATSASTRIDFAGKVYQIKESNSGVTLNGRAAENTEAWLSQDTSMPCVITKKERNGICFQIR